MKETEITNLIEKSQAVVSQAIPYQEKKWLKTHHQLINDIKTEIKKGWDKKPKKYKKEYEKQHKKLKKETKRVIRRHRWMCHISKVKYFFYKSRYFIFFIIIIFIIIYFDLYSLLQIENNTQDW